MPCFSCFHNLFAAKKSKKRDFAGNHLQNVSVLSPGRFPLFPLLPVGEPMCPDHWRASKASISCRMASSFARSCSDGAAPPTSAM